MYRQVDVLEKSTPWNLQTKYIFAKLTGHGGFFFLTCTSMTSVKLCLQTSVYNRQFCLSQRQAHNNLFCKITLDNGRVRGRGRTLL